MELLIQYRDSDDQITERRISDIEPLDEKSVVAYCHLRQEERTFLLKRIESAVDTATGELVPNLYEMLGLPNPPPGSAPTHLRSAPPATPNEAKRQRTKDRWDLYKHFRLAVLIDLAKQRLLAFFSNACFNCGSSNQLVIDHHIPLILGGRLVPGNLVVLCGTCNGLKRDSAPADYYSPRHLATLPPLLDAQKDLFAFQFDYKAWDSDREAYLLKLGVNKNLVASVLDDETHPMYVGRGMNRTAFVISAAKLFNK